MQTVVSAEAAPAAVRITALMLIQMPVVVNCTKKQFIVMF